MSLCVLLYHRACAGLLGNPVDMLDRHFAEIAQRHVCVLPGERLTRGRLNICLSFDDAYYDFLVHVVPLLEKHGLRALLAVAPGLIAEAATLPESERLALPADEAFAFPELGGLCTWPELARVAASGRVAFAAHGRTHVRLDSGGTDLVREIIEPRELLETRLHARIESFVYPFGRFNRTAHSIATANYRHVFRIGQASNGGWAAPMLYRIVADGLPSPAAPFAVARRLRWRWNRYWNRWRGI